MTAETEAAEATPKIEQRPNRLLYWLAVLLVLVGLSNTIPGIPGFDQAVRDLSGTDWLVLRKFPREWFFPSFLPG